MKVSEILNAKAHLESILQKEMCLSAALEVARFAKEASAEINTFETKRVELVKKFGTEKEGGSFIVEDEDGKVKFQKALEKILNKEVDIKKIDSTCDIDVKPSEVINFSYLYE
jgi:hypothetical protein